MLINKKSKARNYEILFLQNTKDQDVEVHEVNKIDFPSIKKRLELGESVFITSKSSQKLIPSKSNPRNQKTKMITAFHFDPV